MSKSKANPCGICSLREKANSILCVQCGKWVHSRCAGVKRVSAMLSRNFACIKCEGNWRGRGAGRRVVKCKQQWNLHILLTVSAGAGCEAAVTARTRCGWAKPMECGELLYGRRLPLKLKGAVHKSYVRPVIQYGSEAWCLKESNKGVLQRTERSMVRAMCGALLKDIQRSTDSRFILGLKETIDQLAMANSVRWYGHVLRRE